MIYDKFIIKLLHYYNNLGDSVLEWLECWILSPVISFRSRFPRYHSTFLFLNNNNKNNNNSNNKKNNNSNNLLAYIAHATWRNDRVHFTKKNGTYDKISR